MILQRPGFAELLDLAVAQPRRYGAGDPAVLDRLLQLLREVAWLATDPDQQRGIAEQLARLRATIETQSFDAAEQAMLGRTADEVVRALEGRWRHRS